MTVAAAVQGTAIVVAMDMTGGIIDRFRTMAIARSAVLTGHVLASLIQSLAQHRHRARRRRSRSASAPTAGVLDWLAAIGVLTLFAFALIWLATALGLAAKSVETASNTPMFLTFLPFLGSGFVLIATMPTGLRQFAQLPALHPRHRDPARPPHRNPDRQQRHHRRRLERRHRPRLLPLGQTPLHPQALGLTPAGRPRRFESGRGLGTALDSARDPDEPLFP